MTCDISVQAKYLSNITDILQLSHYSLIIVCITLSQYCSFIFNNDNNTKKKYILIISIIIFLPPCVLVICFPLFFCSVSKKKTKVAKNSISSSTKSTNGKMAVVSKPTIQGKHHSLAHLDYHKVVKVPNVHDQTCIKHLHVCSVPMYQIMWVSKDLDTVLNTDHIWCLEAS